MDRIAKLANAEKLQTTQGTWCPPPGNKGIETSNFLGPENEALPMAFQKHVDQAERHDKFVATITADQSQNVRDETPPEGALNPWNT